MINDGPDRGASRNRHVRLALLLSLTLSILSAVVTPPFQTPDEPAHFVRALALIGGEPHGVSSPQGAGSPIPRGAALLIGHWLYLPPGGRDRERYSPDHFRSASAIRSDQTTVFVPRVSGRRPTRINSNASTYLPLAHVVPGAAMLIPEWAGAPPLLLFYAGRLANAVAGSLLLALAVAITPAFRWSVALIGLLPMAVSLRGSLSPDAVIIPAGILATALVWRMSSTGVTSRGFAALAAVILLLLSIKPAYLVIPLLFLLLPTSCFRSVRSRIFHAAGLVLIVAVAAAASLGWARSSPPAAASGIAVRSGPVALLQDPGAFLRDAGETFRANAGEYVAEMAGKLGWLNVEMPPGSAQALVVVLLLLTLLAPGQPPPRLLFRIASFLLAWGGILLVAAMLYAYAPLDRAGVNGLQGRYFLPFLPMMLPLFASRRFAQEPSAEGIARRTMVGTAIVANLVAAAVVIRAFYVSL